MQFVCISPAAEKKKGLQKGKHLSTLAHILQGAKNKHTKDSIKLCLTAPFNIILFLYINLCHIALRMLCICRDAARTVQHYN